MWLSADSPSGPRCVEVSCPDCCAPAPQAIADWRAAHQWSPRCRPCRYCAAPTHLRADDGAPARKVCRERVGEAAAPLEAGGTR